MKSKIIILALASIFMSSCKSKKVANEVVTVVEEKPIAVLSPVPENPETIKLASTYDGGNLYKNNCANCHQLYNAEEFSKEDWVPIMKRMQNKAMITDAETLAIYNYLAAQTN